MTMPENVIDGKWCSESRGSVPCDTRVAQYPLLEAESEAERIIGVYAAGQVVPCGAFDRTVYVLNGVSGDLAVLDFADGTAKAEVFDAAGKAAGTVKLCRGVQRVAVPRSGYLRIVPPADYCMCKRFGDGEVQP